MTTQSRTLPGAVVLLVLLAACTSGTPAVQTTPPTPEGGTAVGTEPPAGGVPARRRSRSAGCPIWSRERRGRQSRMG